MIERSVVYQGPAYLKRLKTLDPRVRLLPPLRSPGDLDQLADQLKPYGVDVDWRILSKELVDRCHATGILVFSDALGEHETLPDYAQAIAWGVDVIQTDHPARVYRAFELQAQRASRQP
jgi:glycerophosphoryl diester phosphodiesterase